MMILSKLMSVSIKCSLALFLSVSFLNPSGSSVVNIKGFDGSQVFSLSKDEANLSLTIKNLIDDLGGSFDEPIPFSNIRSSLLETYLVPLMKIAYHSPQKLHSLLINFAKKKTPVGIFIDMYKAANFLDHKRLYKALSDFIGENIQVFKNEIKDLADELKVSIVQSYYSKNNGGFASRQHVSFSKDLKTQGSPALSDNGLELLVGFNDNTICLFNTLTFEQIARVTFPKNSKILKLFFKDGLAKALVSTFDDSGARMIHKDIIMVDIKSKNQTTDENFRLTEFSPEKFNVDVTKVIYASDSTAYTGVSHVYDLSKKKFLFDVPSHAIFSVDGKSIITINEDKIEKIETSTGNTSVIVRLKSQIDRPSDVQWSDDGNVLFWTDNSTDKAYMYNFETEKIVSVDISEMPGAFYINHNGSVIVFFDYKTNEINVLNVPSDLSIQKIQVNKNADISLVKALFFGSNNDNVCFHMTGSDYDRIYMYSVSKGELLGKSRGRISSVLISRDGLIMIQIYSDGMQVFSRTIDSDWALKRLPSLLQ